MTGPLRVLIIEDSEDDALLLTRELGRGGREVAPKRVDSAESLRSALEEREWDLILCDHAMPGFGSSEALSIVQETGHDLPFIIVSGAIGEESAVAAMRAGAHDVVMKDKPALLPPAVERELREAEVRRRGREVEASLRKATHTLESLLRSSTRVAVAITDRDLVIQHFNEAAEQLFDCTADEVVGRSVRDVHARVDVDPAAFEAAMAELEREGRWESNLERRGADGETRFVFRIVMPMRDASGACEGYILFARDVTDRRLAEEALRTSEAKYKTLFESSKDAILLGTADTGVMAGNPASVRMFGCKSEDELLGLGPLDLSSEYQPDGRRSAEKIPELVALVMEKGSHSCEWKHRALDGREFYARLQIVRLELEGEVRLLATVRDITEEKRIGEQLRQAAKMQAVGRLAAGVAHDFNNLLTGILGCAELLAPRVEGDERAAKLVGEIQQCGERAASVARQLLAFSRKQIVRPEDLDLGRVVHSMDKMLRRLIGEDVELAASIEMGLRPVCADRGQMEQLVMNLAVNARDAMPSGGTLSLEAHNAFLEPGSPRPRPDMVPGNYVILSVADNGVGIPAELHEKIFDPFFTTKEVGAGTGLGLATVHGIVRQCGGRVVVTSEVDVGSRFDIYLPAVEGPARADSEPAEDPAPPRGSETILIVEDEDLVCKIAKRSLAQAGYEVLTASGGEQALELAQSHAGPIDLLLTDVVLPHTNGRELAERLGELRPEMKIIYMSGYADGAIARHGVLEEGINFLPKPFTPRSLNRMVGNVLAAEAET